MKATEVIKKLSEQADKMSELAKAVKAQASAAKHQANANRSLGTLDEAQAASLLMPVADAYADLHRYCEHSSDWLMRVIADPQGEASTGDMPTK